VDESTHFLVVDSGQWAVDSGQWTVDKDNLHFLYIFYVCKGASDSICNYVFFSIELFDMSAHKFKYCQLLAVQLSSAAGG